MKHAIYWTNRNGLTGCTLVHGSMYKARSVWAVQFQPHGYALNAITKA